MESPVLAEGLMTPAAFNAVGVCPRRAGAIATSDRDTRWLRFLAWLGGAMMGEQGLATAQYCLIVGSGKACHSPIKTRLGERFYRMWEFYLAGCKMSFRYDGLMVFQTQLTNDIAALPLTRDYMAREEAYLTRRLAGTTAEQIPIPHERKEKC